MVSISCLCFTCITCHVTWYNMCVQALPAHCSEIDIAHVWQVARSVGTNIGSNNVRYALIILQRWQGNMARCQFICRESIQCTLIILIVLLLLSLSNRGQPMNHSHASIHPSVCQSIWWLKEKSSHYTSVSCMVREWCPSL